MDTLVTIMAVVAGATMVVVPAQQLVARRILEPQRRPVRIVVWLAWSFLAAFSGAATLSVGYLWWLGGGFSLIIVLASFLIGWLTGVAGGMFLAFRSPWRGWVPSHVPRGLEELLSACYLYLLVGSNSASRHWTRGWYVIGADLKREYRELLPRRRRGRPRQDVTVVRRPLRERLRETWQRFTSLWLVRAVGYFCVNFWRTVVVGFIWRLVCLLVYHLLWRPVRWVARKLWHHLVVRPFRWVVDHYFRREAWKKRRIVMWIWPWAAFLLFRLGLWIGFGQVRPWVGIFFHVLSGFLSVSTCYLVFTQVWLVNPLEKAGMLDASGRLIFSSTMPFSKFEWPVNRWWGLVQLLFQPEKDVPRTGYLWLLWGHGIRMQLGVKYAAHGGQGGLSSKDFKDVVWLHFLGPADRGWENYTKVSPQQSSPGKDVVPTFWHWWFDAAMCQFQITSRGEADWYHLIPTHFRGMEFDGPDPEGNPRTEEAEEALKSLWYWMNDAGKRLDQWWRNVVAAEQRQPIYERLRQEEAGRRDRFGGF